MGEEQRGLPEPATGETNMVETGPEFMNNWPQESLPKFRSKKGRIVGLKWHAIAVQWRNEWWIVGRGKCLSHKFASRAKAEAELRRRAKRNGWTEVTG